MKRIRSITAGLAALALATVAPAQTTNYWTNGVGTANWSTAGNWSLGSYPTLFTEHIEFTNDASSAYTVQLSGVSTSGTIRVGTDKVTYDINGYQ